MKFMRLLAFALCGALSFAGLSTPAQAAYNIVEATMPSSTSDGNLFNLCSSECVQDIATLSPKFGRSPSGKILSAYEDGYYAGETAESKQDRVLFPNPAAGDYKVSVYYTDGSYVAWGYLKQVASGYELTKDWTEASLIPVPVSGSMGVFNIVKNTTPTPDPVELRSATGKVYLVYKGEYAAPGGQIGFCNTACLDASENIVAAKTGANGVPAKANISSGSNDYFVNNFPAGNYRVAVVFNGIAKGYLVKSGSETKLTPDFNAASSYSELSSEWTLQLGQASTTPKATYDVNSPMWGGVFSYFEYTITNAEVGTSVKAEVIGCDNRVVASKIVYSSGDFNFKIYPEPKQMGKAWKLRTTIAAPGHASDVSVLSNYIGAQYFPACPSTVSPPTPRIKPFPAAIVKHWGKIKGKVKAHKKVKAVGFKWGPGAKKVTGERVKYQWYINGKLVKTGKAYKIPKYVKLKGHKVKTKGKKLTLKVSVYKKGYKTKVKNINRRIR